MGPDMRRNRYLDRQLDRLKAESTRLNHCKRLLPQHFRDEVVIAPESPRDTSHSGREDAEELLVLRRRWHELPGKRNDLWEAELQRSRHEWKHIQDRSLCSTMSRLEREADIKLERHWNSECQLRDIAWEHAARTALESSSAWLMKHEELQGWPRDLYDWHSCLERQRQELLCADGPKEFVDWKKSHDSLLSIEIERRARVQALERFYAEEEMGIRTPRHVQASTQLDVPRTVAMRTPCAVERELEKRLGLSTSARAVEGNVQYEAAQDNGLERELEERLGLSRLSQLDY